MKALFKNKAIHADLGLLILRLTAGYTMFWQHGLGKITRIINGEEIMFVDPLGIGMTLSFYLVVFAEVVCAVLLALGLFSRFSALVLLINCAVIVYHHSSDGMGKLELPMLYLSIFVALLLTGSGKYSLDKLMGK